MSINPEITFDIAVPRTETVEKTWARVERFLYSNFRLVAWTQPEDGDQAWIIVEGAEVAGFTKQAQVDRLASGSLFERRP